MTVIWILLLGSYIVSANRNYTYGAICSMILFILLGGQLLAINGMLNSQMKKIFKERMNDDTFKKEKRYLFITLVSFSISYLIDVIRNAVLWEMLNEIKDSNRTFLFICENNCTMSLYNIAIWAVTELTPYMIIFWLNLANFRQMGRQDEYVQNRM